MNLPPSLLPEALDELSLEEVCDAAVHTAKLHHRSHYDLGRVLSHIRERGSGRLGY